MTEEKQQETLRVVVVVVGTAGAKCRACGAVVERGDRAWFRIGHGLQHLECPLSRVVDADAGV